MTTTTVVKSFSKIGMALTAITAIGLATSTAAGATTLTVLEDNFNTENGGVGVLNYNSFTKWDVTGGTVDLIGSNGFFNFLPGNGQYVDTDGSTGNAGILSSKATFSFAAGDIVDLTFKLAGNQRNNQTDSVIVSLGSLLNETFTLPAFQGFTTFTRSFTVASPTSAKLAFEGIGGDNVGLLLDDVKLTKTVPEPTAMLGILAFGAFGAASLTKRKKSIATAQA